MENKLTFEVSGKGIGMKTELAAGNHTIILDELPKMGGDDAGPDPLTALLAALAGCENVLANIVAEELEFDLEEIEFHIKGIIDPRGFMGDPAVKPYFEKITVDAKVKTSESQERVNLIKQGADSRCPVFTILKAAGVELETNWVKV